MSLVSIDPGVHDAGVALWDDDHELIDATLVRSKSGGWGLLAGLVVHWVESHFLDIRDIVVEQPQVYPQNRQKGDPNDLIAIALSAGATAMAISIQYPEAKIVMLLPATWKGQTPKEISNKRTKNQLGVVERSRIDLPRAKTLQHNVFDAIGIGLYWLRRKRGK